VNPERTEFSHPYEPCNTGIVIEKWIGRLGNNLLQLRSAYLMAKMLNAQTVIAPEHEFFKTVRTDSMSFVFGNIELNEIHQVLVGDFFPIPFKHYHKVFGERYIQDFYDELKPCLTLIERSDLTDRDLVLFVRSGDIFTIDQDIIRGYGQPPLSFYKSCIKLHNPERIFLLAEDDANSSWEQKYLPPELQLLFRIYLIFLKMFPTVIRLPAV
jgi:hypothetical protein